MRLASDDVQRLAVELLGAAVSDDDVGQDAALLPFHRPGDMGQLLAALVGISGVLVEGMARWTGRSVEEVLQVLLVEVEP